MEENGGVDVEQKKREWVCTWLAENFEAQDEVDLSLLKGHIWQLTWLLFLFLQFRGSPACRRETRESGEWRAWRSRRRGAPGVGDGCLKGGDALAK